MRDFLRRNKETIQFCYMCGITILFVVVLLYAILMSRVAADLTNVVKMRETELGEMQFDMNYISAMNGDLYDTNEQLFRELTECELKLDRKDVENER